MDKQVNKSKEQIQIWKDEQDKIAKENPSFDYQQVYAKWCADNDGLDFELIADKSADGKLIFDGLYMQELLHVLKAQSKIEEFHKDDTNFNFEEHFKTVYKALDETGNPKNTSEFIRAMYIYESEGGSMDKVRDYCGYLETKQLSEYLKSKDKPVNNKESTKITETIEQNKIDQAARDAWSNGIGDTDKESPSKFQQRLAEKKQKGKELGGKSLGNGKVLGGKNFSDVVTVNDKTDFEAGASKNVNEKVQRESYTHISQMPTNDLPYKRNDFPDIYCIVTDDSVKARFSGTNFDLSVPKGTVLHMNSEGKINVAVSAPDNYLNCDPVSKGSFPLESVTANVGGLGRITAEEARNIDKANEVSKYCDKDFLANPSKGQGELNMAVNKSKDYAQKLMDKATMFYTRLHEDEVPNYVELMSVNAKKIKAVENKGNNIDSNQPSSGYDFV